MLHITGIGVAHFSLLPILTTKVPNLLEIPYWKLNQKETLIRGTRPMNFVTHLFERNINIHLKIKNDI